MTSHVKSADGTRIAYERAGKGEPIILAAGILCDRSTLRDLAAALAPRFSVINFDRRGRGDSGCTAPYAVEREVEDVAALIAAAGGRAALYGHSSGAGLALHAAAAGLPVSRLVLHEPPYGPDDELSKNQSRELAVRIKAALAEDRRAHAIRIFFANMGMPAETIDGICADPRMLALAPTMRHDYEVMGELSRGGVIPEDIMRAIRTPTLVITGAASPDFFRETAARLVELLPDGRLATLDGHDHGAPAEVLAPVIAGFVAGQMADA